MERGLKKIQWILWRTKRGTKNHRMLDLEWNIYSLGNSLIQHKQQHDFKPSCQGGGFLLLVSGLEGTTCSIASLTAMRQLWMQHWADFRTGPPLSFVTHFFVVL